jgi:cob(I)alamin adenosyltransferase
MKIYTRTGDDGTTGLIGGRRVRKSDPRIDCYGTVDELNAALGLALAAAEQAAGLAPAPASGPAAPDLAPAVREVQSDLFVIGSHLATPDDSPHRAALPPLDESMVRRLEQQIDAAESQLPPLHQFILPGGTETAARLHLARTVCRRAERRLVEWSAEHPVPPVLLTYLNRLSDWLFVYARLANARAGVADVPWVKS